ncbi:MAG: NUDIX hydrolase domain-like protein [Monoraphidium minutum]|nr:MAG: NUDIX hydrolase domain-like protein [Monoraphidium minutum]
MLGSAAGSVSSHQLIALAAAGARAPLGRLRRAASAARPLAPSSPRSMATGGVGEQGQGEFTYKWPRPALTVDAAVVVRAAAGAGAAAPPRLLLIQRKHPPCQGQWALPGGFVDQGEGLEAAAARELREETSLDPSSVPMVQVGAFGDPGRDPRGWTVTVCFAALAPPEAEAGIAAADDAADARLFPVDTLPPLAFDHKLVVRRALRRLAELPEAAAGSLAEALVGAAGKLEGPWTPPTE